MNPEIITETDLMEVAQVKSRASSHCCGAVRPHSPSPGRAG